MVKASRKRTAYASSIRSLISSDVSQATALASVVSIVGILRHHFHHFPSEALAFTNNAGAHITPHNYGKAWGRARTHLRLSPHPLSSIRVYDLRHSAATMMLSAGVNPAEVARRLGHSVDMLMKICSGVYRDERDQGEPSVRPMVAGPRCLT